MSYQGTFGVHFLPHHEGWNRLTAAELVRLGDTAAAGGLRTIWFSSRFLARESLTLMAALAARAPVNLGTMVYTPWGQNPLHLADSLLTVAELLADDRELFFGLGSGVSQTRWVERPRPVRFVRETIEVCQRLLAGDEVAFSDYPLVADYFHLHGGGQLGRAERVSFWLAPQGPLANKLAADLADGIFVEAGTRLGLRALHDVTLDRLIEEIERQRTRPLRRILGLEMSISRDRAAAFERAEMHRQLAASRRGLAGQLQVPEMFLVGTPDEVADQLSGCLDAAERLGCEHILFSAPVGPDPQEAVELVGQVVAAALRPVAPA